ncbi:MAG: hypothetical protein ACYS0I_16035 [Planctomycetota bacterium]|jgi:hypothetical protein
MKTYKERKYPIEALVKVSYPGNVWIDGIDGLNLGHAVWRARQNWKRAEIKVVAYGPKGFVIP